MFEKYNEKARRALFFARYEASKLGSRVIESEHILLGIRRSVGRFELIQVDGGIGFALAQEIHRGIADNREHPDPGIAAAEAIEGMLEDGLIVISDVEMVRLVRRQQTTEVPDAAGSGR